MKQTMSEIIIEAHMSTIQRCAKPLSIVSKFKHVKEANINWFYLSTICLFLQINIVNAQSYIADTIIVPTRLIEKTDTIGTRFSVEDYRGDDAHFISMFEKKKWLFFPIDQVVTTIVPLPQILEENANQTSDKNYLLGIHNYYIQNSESMTKRLFKLNASIELSSISIDNKDTTLLGTFYYEEYSKQKKKDSLLYGYAALLNKSNNLLFSDMHAVIIGLDGQDQKQNYHFRRGYPVAKKNFYVYSDLFAGLNFWGFDIELNFSSPEPSKKFKRKSRMLRFMDFENRQSVAIARNVSYFNYRISERFLFQNKHAFLLGFNRWYDIDEAKRTLEELFLFQLTATQKITYNPIDKSSLVFGVGLMEDFSYIIYNKPMLNIAIVANIGFKF